MGERENTCNKDVESRILTSLSSLSLEFSEDFDYAIYFNKVLVNFRVSPLRNVTSESNLSLVTKLLACKSASRGSP